MQDVAIPRSVRPESFATHTSNSFFFAYDRLARGARTRTRVHAHACAHRYEPKDLAAEITAIDFDLYSAINLKECLGQARYAVPADRTPGSPGLARKLARAHGSARSGRARNGWAWAGVGEEG